MNMAGFVFMEMSFLISVFGEKIAAHLLAAVREGYGDTQEAAGRLITTCDWGWEDYQFGAAP